MPFENIYPPAFESFLQRIFIMFSCVKALSVLLSLNLHPHPQLHKFPIFALLSFLLSRPNEVAFVSSRFENPLSRTSYFLDGFQLKKQNLPFKSIMVDYTGPQYRYYYFHTTHKVYEKGFLSHISTLKSVPSDQKSNCCACAEG